MSVDRIRPHVVREYVLSDGLLPWKGDVVAQRWREREVVDVSEGDVGGVAGEEPGLQHLRLRVRNPLTAPSCGGGCRHLTRNPPFPSGARSNGGMRMKYESGRWKA